MVGGQNLSDLLRLGVPPQNVKLTTVAPLKDSDGAMEAGSSTVIEQNTDPAIVDNVTRRTGVKAYLENLLDAHSASQFMEGERANVPTETSSIKASTVKGGAGLGLGMATGHLLSQLGVNNPYVNPVPSAWAVLTCLRTQARMLSFGWEVSMAPKWPPKILVWEYYEVLGKVGRWH